MENIKDVKGLPLIGGLLKSQMGDDETPEEKLLINEMIEKYSSELASKHELLKKFETISTDLIKMGFPPKMVLRSFIVHKYSTAEEGIEILSKSDKLWNHKFIDSYRNKCFVCGDLEELHFSIKNIMVKMNSSIIDAEKLKIVLNTNKPTNEINNFDKKPSSIIIRSDSCPICFLEITEGTVFSLNCKHKFCKDCIIYYLEEEIKNARVKNISCPQSKCTINFSEEIIKSIVKEEDFKKYLKFLDREKIREQKDLIHCPILDCEGYGSKPENEAREKDAKLINDNDNPEQKLLPNEVALEVFDKNRKIKYICNKGHPFCGNCKSIWHSDECSEDRDVKNFATTTGHMVKKCIGCRVWTEKTEGCNHMTCQLCKAEWCWLCEQKYTPEHYQTPGPCFGRMFNDPDPLLLQLQELDNEWPLFYFIFFVYIWSMFLVDVIIRNNFAPQNQNRRTKMYIFGLIFLLTGTILVMALCLNLFLVAYFVKSIIKCNEVQNGCVRTCATFSFLIMFFMFYFTGMILTTIWFIVINFYCAIKLCLV